MSLWPPTTHVSPSPRGVLALLAGLAFLATAAPAVAGKVPNRVQKLEAREDGGRVALRVDPRTHLDAALRASRYAQLACLAPFEVDLDPPRRYGCRPPCMDRHGRLSRISA